MAVETVMIGIKIVPWVAGIIMFATVRICYREHVVLGKVLVKYKELAGFVREKSRDSSYYQRKERWLLQNGAGIHYSSKLTPTGYLAMRLVLAAISFGILAGLSVEGAIAGGVILFFLPDWLLMYLNRRDNERLLPELKLVYNALELQIRAGVYITDALAECYGSVKERRLREALLDLAGDIAVRADIYDALNKFQSKFDNRYVDTLCITIIQALESGQAVDMLSDIGEQIRDMEQALLERKKAALDRSLTFYQLGILAAVLMIALYACVKHMLNAAIIF